MNKKTLLLPLIAIIMATLTLTSCITEVKAEDIAGKTFIKTNKESNSQKDFWEVKYTFNQDGTYEYWNITHTTNGNESGLKVTGTYKLGLKLEITAEKGYYYTQDFGKAPQLKRDDGYATTSKMSNKFKIDYDENGDPILINTFYKEEYTLLHK